MRKTLSVPFHTALKKKKSMLGTHSGKQIKHKGPITLCSGACIDGGQNVLLPHLSKIDFFIQLIHV